MTTPYKMIEQAELHVGAFLSEKERLALANAVPSDVPWREEGMPFVEAMVIGFAVSKTLK